MRFEDINRASLEQLLYFVDTYKKEPRPILNSRDVLLIVRSDVGHFESRGLGYNGRKFSIQNYGKNLGNERFKWAVGGTGKNMDYSMYLSNLGVHVELLSDQAIEMSFYEYIYKNNIPLPRDLWYDSKALFMPSEIYNIPNNNWEEIIPYQIEREELLNFIQRDYSLNVKVYRKIDFLAFQTEEQLLQLIEDVPELGEKYAGYTKDIEVNKRFLIAYISNFGLSVNQRLLDTLRKYHDPTGQREDMINKYISNGGNKTIFRSESGDIRHILIYPPYWFEKDFMMGNLSPKQRGVDDLEKFIRLLIEDGVVDRRYDALNDVMYYIDPKDPSTEVPNRLPTHKEICNMIKERDPKLKFMSRDVILRSVGVVGNTKYEDDSRNNIRVIQKILSDFDIIKFDIYTVFNMCPSRTDNIFLYDYVDFVFTYGSYLKLYCMSPEDLIAAFSPDDEGLLELRSPLSSQKVFSSDEVKQLRNLIAEQNPDAIPNFKERCAELGKSIQKVLNGGYTVEIMIKILDKKMKSEDPVDKRDIELFKLFMVNIFEAGMYQRLWKGKDSDGKLYPYPMLNSETRDNKTNQYDIDIRMGPSLSNAMEAYEKMSSEFKKSFSSFRSFASIFGDGADVGMTSYKILDIVEQTIGCRDDSGNNVSYEERIKKGEEIRGSFCVAYASSIFITSAYEFLLMVGEKIENFDLKKMESSTHRINF